MKVLIPILFLEGTALPIRSNVCVFVCLFVFVSDIMSYLGTKCPLQVDCNISVITGYNDNDDTMPVVELMVVFMVNFAMNQMVLRVMNV